MLHCALYKFKLLIFPVKASDKTVVVSVAAGPDV